MNSELEATLLERKNANVKNLSEISPLRLFLEPRVFPTHICQAIQVLVDSLKTYMIISLTGVLLFAAIYWIIGCTGNPIKESCKVYWSFDVNAQLALNPMAFIETVYRDCIGVCMLGKIVAGMMVPNNPIEFSNFFIVTKNGRIKLRYWIMLPIGALLHNPELRIMLIEDGEFFSGDGELKAKLKVKWNYSGIRGVRSLTLDEMDSKKILSELMQADTKNKLVFMISGGLVEGRRYFSEKRYTIEDMLYADDYLSIRKDEYPDGLERKADIPDKLYMNFNMAYKKEENRLNIFYKPSKYVKSKNKMLKGHKFSEPLRIDQNWYKWMFEGVQGMANVSLNHIVMQKYDRKRRFL